MRGAGKARKEMEAVAEGLAETAGAVGAFLHGAAAANYALVSAVLAVLGRFAAFAAAALDGAAPSPPAPHHS